MPIYFREYQCIIRKLTQLASSEKPVALRHLEQLNLCFAQYFSAPANDLPNSNPLDFPPLILKVREIEKYLSSVYKKEL